MGKNENKLEVKETKVEENALEENNVEEGSHKLKSSKIKFWTKKFIVSLVGIVVIGSIILTLAYLFDDIEKTNALEESNLMVQGNLKTVETNLNTKVAGTIKEIRVSEGDSVRAGDVLLVLDSQSLLAKKEQAEAALVSAQSQYNLAKAGYDAANAQYEKALNGTRDEELAQLQSACELAEKTFQRVETLYEGGVASESDYDEAKTNYSVAKEKYELGLQGTRQEDISMAKASVDESLANIGGAEGQIYQAQASIAEIESYLEDMVIKAPSSGSITSLNVEVGELVSSGMSLAVISSLQKPWVEVNVDETDIGLVSVGQNVKVTLVAYPNQEFEGIVTKVNQKPDFATKRATNAKDDFDILSYGVKVEISGLDNYNTYPGMTVMVDFGEKSNEEILE